MRRRSPRARRTLAALLAAAAIAAPLAAPAQSHVAAAVDARAETPRRARPNPIFEPGRRWAFEGFSIAPPQGGGWYSLTRTRTRATFGRDPDSATRVIVAAVVAERAERPFDSADVFVRHLQSRRGRPLGDVPLKVRRVEERRDDRDGAWCTAYRVIADDDRTPGEPRVLRVEGRTCLHPEARDLLVDVSVAERGLPREIDVDAVGTADFSRTLRFLPLDSGRVLAAADALVASGKAAEAALRVRPLAERDDPAAALWLARAYEVGRGVPADPAEAERLYRLAADAGEPDALYNLGVLREQAHAGARDAGEAALWFRRAADQRDAQAQLNLGLLYFKGDGVQRNHSEARAWLELAAANGNERARDLVATLRFEPSPWDGLPVRPTVITDPP